MKKRKEKKRIDWRSEPYGAWHSKFLLILRETGSRSAACRETPIDPGTVDKHRKEDKEFALQYRQMLSLATDDLEERAREMAMVDGNTQMMLACLKAWRPKRWNRELYLKKEEQKQQNVNVSVYIPENGRDVQQSLPNPGGNGVANLPPPADSYPSSAHGQEDEKKV